MRIVFDSKEDIEKASLILDGIDVLLEAILTPPPSPPGRSWPKPKESPTTVAHLSLVREQLKEAASGQ